MYIRNYKGNIVFFDKEKYAFEYDMYVDLWKILYNIDLYKEKDNILKDFIKKIF